MIQITYVSTLKPGAPATTFDDVARAAERHNRRNGLSGLLLFDGGQFLQVLEGPDTRVLETLDRILADHRHCEVTLLNQREIACACFLGFAVLSCSQPGQGRDLARLLAPVMANADPATRIVLENFIAPAAWAA